MEKVKVKRYVSGKRPDYAPMDSSDEEEEDLPFVKKGKEMELEIEVEEEEVSDPRLKRLLNRVSEDVEERYVESMLDLGRSLKSVLKFCCFLFVSSGSPDTDRSPSLKLWLRAARTLMKARGTQSTKRAVRMRRRRRKRKKWMMRLISDQL